MGTGQKLTLGERLSASLMFFVGFLNIMGAVFCLVGLLVFDIFGDSVPGAWDWVAVGFFMGVAQQATAMWVVCMPQVKSLYRQPKGNYLKKQD